MEQSLIVAQHSKFFLHRLAEPLVVLDRDKRQSQAGGQHRTSAAAIFEIEPAAPKPFLKVMGTFLPEVRAVGHGKSFEAAGQHEFRRTKPAFVQEPHVPGLLPANLAETFQLAKQSPSRRIVGKEVDDSCELEGFLTFAGKEHTVNILYVWRFPRL